MLLVPGFEHMTFRLVPCYISFLTGKRIPQINQCTLKGSHCPLRGLAVIAKTTVVVTGKLTQSVYVQESCVTASLTAQSCQDYLTSQLFTRVKACRKKSSHYATAKAQL